MPIRVLVAAILMTGVTFTAVAQTKEGEPTANPSASASPSGAPASSTTADSGSGAQKQLTSPLNQGRAAYTTPTTKVKVEGKPVALPGR